MDAKGIVKSMRLRTLPLSEAGVILGIMLASRECSAPWYLILLILLTTGALQVLSNMSNELGDFLHGVDSLEREGPQYAIQQGKLTSGELSRVIRYVEILCYLCGATMTWVSFGTLLCRRAAALLLLGASAVWAAKHYTLGKHPYGYMAMGDLFVFIFFGLVPVLGAFFLVAHTITTSLLLLPAVSVGLFSVAVLNVNNIRDIATDKGTRLTVPILIGVGRAKIYHTFLIAGGWLSAIAFIHHYGECGWEMLSLATMPLFALHLAGLWRGNGRNLDPMLPLLVISTFLFSILLGAGLM